MSAKCPSCGKEHPAEIRADQWCMGCGYNPAGRRMRDGKWWGWMGDNPWQAFFHVLLFLLYCVAFPVFAFWAAFGGLDR